MKIVGNIIEYKEAIKNGTPLKCGRS